MQPVGVCLTNTRRLEDYALAAWNFYGAESSKKPCHGTKIIALQRLFFATSNPVTAAFWRTLGFPQIIFQLFSATFLLPEDLFTLFMKLVTAAISGTLGFF